MIYCAVCVGKRQSGLTCPKCDSPLVLPGPVEIVEAVGHSDHGVTQTLQEWLSPGAVVVLIRRETHFAVLQHGFKRLTVWEPRLIVTRFEDEGIR